MSTKKYGLGAAMLLLVLCSFASATLVNESQTYYGRNAIANLWPDDRTLEVGPLGNVNFVERTPNTGDGDKPRVDMDGTASQECAIIMNGGILNIAVNFNDAALEVTDNGNTFPERVYVNKGTMTCGRLQILTNRNGKIIVSGGTLIVQQYYLSGNNTQDPAKLALDGRLEAAPGYELVFTDLGTGLGGNGNAVKITAVRSSFNPNPAHLSTTADLNLASVCWDSYDTKIYKVYFAQADANEGDYLTKLTYRGKSAVVTDPNILTNLCYSLGGLTPLIVDKTYSWALEAYGAVVGGEPNGPMLDVSVYKFFTSAIPTIITQPQTVAVDFGGTAVLSTVVQSSTPLISNKWYKTTDGTNYTEVTVGTIATVSLGGGQYQLTLTQTPVTTSAQVGRFRCIAQNSAGFSLPTNTVNIVCKAMLAHWDFNNNLLDSAPKDALNTTVYNATAAVTPVYDTGHNLDPNSLSFDGTNQYLTLPSGFGNFRAGMSIAMNFRMDPSTGRWARLVEFTASADPNGKMVSLFREDNTYDEMWFRTLGGATPSEVNPNGIHDLGAWSYLVLTMDQNGLVRFYKNGFEGANSPAGTVTVPVQAARDNNRIGWDWAGSVAKLNGRIGDLRIYNYPISDTEVKTLYAEANGPFCVTHPALDYDQTGASNCVVDTADLLFFAQQWLKCGLWPVSACP